MSRVSAETGGVVSLVPSITETLLDWGVEVAACTRFCEQPHVRHVGGTKNPDIAAIAALAPRVVLMDTEENRREDADALIALGLRVVATEVHSVADVDPALELLAAAVDVHITATASPSTLSVADPAPLAARRRALVPIWRRPWMAIGPSTYGASLLERLGIDVVPTGGDRYPVVDLDAFEPDLVLVPSEPYEFRDEHLTEMAMAMPGADIRRVDGRDLFWWGSRTPGAIARLAMEFA